MTTKICKHCKLKKPLEDYYACKGVVRPECKKCTIKKNGAYQRRTKAWLTRFGDVEARKNYFREYYHNNPDKHAKYRDNFRKTHPEYYREYYRNRKSQRIDKKRGSKDTPSQLNNTTNN